MGVPISTTRAPLLVLCDSTREGSPTTLRIWITGSEEGFLYTRTELVSFG